MTVSLHEACPHRIRPGRRARRGAVVRAFTLILVGGTWCLGVPGCGGSSGGGENGADTLGAGQGGTTTGPVHTSTGGSSPVSADGGGGSSGGASTSGPSVSSGGSSASVSTGGSAVAGGAAVPRGTGGATAGGATSEGASGGGAGGRAGAGSSATGAGGAAQAGTPPTSAVAACVTNELSMCKTNTTPTSESFSIPYAIECHFGGDPGNYEVVIELGGAEAGDTLVEAERRRPMLPEVTTAAGQLQQFAFVVNVRQPEGEPVQDKPAGIAGLDVYFGGPTPKLTSICHRPIVAPVVLYVAGDSTVCDQYTDGYASWGQHLAQFFVEPISVANYADSGESSVSFLHNNSLWGAIKSRVKAGDFVLLEMGHNDKTTSQANFEANMMTMATDAKAAGANPIFVTPISRANGGCAGQLVTAAMDIPQTLKDLAKSMSLPVIDLTTATCNWFSTVGGPAAAEAAYYARGTDPTHTGPKGAQIYAGFVRDAIRAGIPELAKYLRP